MSHPPLTQTHLVRQDAVEALVAQAHHPAQPLHLVLPQLATCVTQRKRQANVQSGEGRGGGREKMWVQAVERQSCLGNGLIAMGLPVGR